MVGEHGEVITGEELMEIFDRGHYSQAFLLINGIVAFRGMERSGEEGKYAIFGVSPGKGNFLREDRAHGVIRAVGIKLDGCVRYIM